MVGTTNGQHVPITVSERGLNVTALCVFGVPLVGLAGVVAAYQFFWGAGDELLMLAVVGGLLAVNAAALRPLQHRLVDLMSVDIDLATEAELTDELNKRIHDV
jgi:hypothetical protein